MARRFSNSIGFGFGLNICGVELEVEGPAPLSIFIVEHPDLLAGAFGIDVVNIGGRAVSRVFLADRVILVGPLNLDPGDGGDGVLRQVEVEPGSGNEGDESQSERRVFLNLRLMVFSREGGVTCLYHTDI